MTRLQRTDQQLIRYIGVGIASNGLIYALYLAVTWAGAEPKIAMTILYMWGVGQSFFFNKKWAFRFTGPTRTALFRYLAVYAIGYGLNLLALTILVDHVGLSHQLVQGVMILVIATVLFLAQRFWVFRPVTEQSST